MHSVLRGILLGLIIVLPGMSGGTVFVIMGMYETIIKDLSKLNIKPHLPLFLGTLTGIYFGGMIFAIFFNSYRDLTAAFLLGCLLASIKSVIKNHPVMNKKRFIFLAMGLVAGFIMAGEPIGFMVGTEETSWLILFLGGAASTAAMIIPGIPGSSILIALGIYDTMLFSIKTLEIMNIVYFGVGSLVGLFSLVKLLEKIYSRFEGLIAYFFAGLIAGSSRALLPHTVTIPVILVYLLGFLMVIFLSSDRKKLSYPNINLCRFRLKKNTNE